LDRLDDDDDELPWCFREGDLDLERDLDRFLLDLLADDDLSRRRLLLSAPESESESDEDEDDESESESDDDDEDEWCRR
jgi:hypothetical protein